MQDAVLQVAKQTVYTVAGVHAMKNNPTPPSSRMTELRLRVIRGEATAQEEVEVAAFLQEIEVQEAERLQPTMARMNAEAERLELEIASLESEAGELADIAAQYEQLIADTRAFLGEFESRHKRLHSAYARVTGLPMTIAS